MDMSDTPGDDDPRLQFGDRPAHAAFQQQIAELLAGSDISEEQKQMILVAMSCPCCGAGGLSFSFKLNDDAPKF